MNDELNDINNYYESLGVPEPNLLSSYYAIKSLEVFGFHDTIRLGDFHQFLTYLYDDQNYYFQIFMQQDPNNIIATALGLHLSDLTDISEAFLDPENRTGVINFILNNRNSMGNWDTSTGYKGHELMDTFQIVRALNDSEEISQLDSDDKDEIYSAVSNYFYSDGYSLLSKDYMSLELLSNMVDSFYQYNRIADLDIPGIYNILKDLYISDFFTGCSLDSTYPILQFRSYPLEYYSLHNLNNLHSHKTTFLALDALRKIYKLGDFGLIYDLIQLKDDILASQLMDENYQDFGGFYPVSVIPDNTKLVDSKSFFDINYYAIKSLELLANELNLGPITTLGFDTTLLHNYIFKDIQTGPTYTYFNPEDSDDMETILQHTYYMIYILKAIGMYTQDDQKIENFVLQNLNYSDIKNVYYSYKISEILDLNLMFNVTLTHHLVQDLYSEESEEFFLNTDNNTFSQESFSWICEMAKNDKIRIDCQYSDNIMLGESNSMTTSICNIILKDFGQYYMVAFESDQVGTEVFNKLPDNTFEKDVFIFPDPINYPQIVGDIIVYNGLVKVSEIPISFQTFYNLITSHNVSKTADSIHIEVNVSISSGIGIYPLYDSNMYVEIYKNGQFLEQKSLSVDHNSIEGYSFFSLNYSYSSIGGYHFKVYLSNPFESAHSLIFETSYQVVEQVKSGEISDQSDDSEETPEIEADYQNAIPLMIAIIIIPSSVIGISTKLKRKTMSNLKAK